MLLARLARVFLVVALLAGWQASLQHPLEHVDKAGQFVHLYDGDSNDDRSPLCDVLNALTACAPDASVWPLAVEQPQQLLQLPSQGAPRVAEAPPFFSQGPPESV